MSHTQHRTAQEEEEGSTVEVSVG